MTELPDGWCYATLGDLIAGDGLFVDGDWVESKDQDPIGEIRLTQLADVGDGEWRNRSDRHLNAATAARLGCTELQAGDVLVARMPDPLGRACLFPGDSKPCVTVVDVAIVRPGSTAVDSRWLMHAINAPVARSAIEALQSGTTRKRISRKNLATVQLPVAPRAEQERIVAAIEEAFSKLDAGDAGLRTIRQLLKRMRDAILAAAVTGRLVPQDPTDTTATKLLADLGIEPLEQDDLPVGWALTTVGDAFRVAVGTTPSRKDSSLWGGDVWWVSSGEVAFNRIRRTRETISDEAVAGRPDRVVPAGTVMLAMIGEGKTRGQPAILEVPAAHNQNCASIRVDGTGVSSEWVYTFLASRYEETRRAGSGNNQPALNKRRIEAIQIPIPPVEEQARITVDVDRQLSFVAACERAVDAGLERSVALRRSVLKAAFEGQLVPQDPTDEPASVLLERIRAERAAARKAKTRRAKAKS